VAARSVRPLTTSHTAGTRNSHLTLASGRPALDHQSVNADDSARIRDLLASNRTLLAWVRTSISFSGLGFAVAKFGLKPDQARLSAGLGMVLVVVALVIALIGYLQHSQLLELEKAPPGSPQPDRWPGVVAASCCMGVCVVLIPYLAVTAA